jgi:hypothetical protein
MKSNKLKKSTILLFLAFITAFSIIAFQRISKLKNGEEFGVDVFYHIQMADAGPIVCLQKSFPHTTQSMWLNHFYDKEMFFHIFLSAVRKWEVLLKGKAQGPPFNTAFFAVIIFHLLIFSFILYQAGPKFAFLALIPYIILSPGFLNRILMLRPHHFSIIFMLLSSWAFIMIDSRKKLWIPVLFAFLFVYSYSNPHFLLISAFSTCIVLFFQHRFKLGLAIILTSILSLIVFMTLHPQFPNTFILWKIQCVDVIIEAIKGSRLKGVSIELGPPQWAWLGYNFGIFVLVFVNLLLFVYATIIAISKNSETKSIYNNLFSYLNIWRPLTISFFILQSFFCILIFFSMRAVEYVLPFVLLTNIALLHDIYKNNIISIKKLFTLAIILLILFPLISYHWTSRLQNLPDKEFHDYSQWAKKHLPPGSIIANLGWGDFTRLFYAAPHCRYLLGLEPMFGFAANPQLYKKMRDFHKGTYIIYPEEMQKITKADFAFIGAANNSERKRAFVMMKYMQYKPVYSSNNGTLFILPKN